MPTAFVVCYDDVDDPLDGLVTDFHTIEATEVSDVHPGFARLRVWYDDPNDPESDYVESEAAFVDYVYLERDDWYDYDVSVAGSYDEEDLETATETVVANFVRRVVGDPDGTYILVVPPDGVEVSYRNSEEIVRVARRDGQ
jgi:hypothetical protein